MDPSNLQAALAVAIDAARAAGRILRDELHRPGGPRGAAGHADADELAERAIRDTLLAAFPWPYVGEETGRAAGDGDTTWLVDPNDGTSEFLHGRRGSAVSIAAVRGGVPVLGVVHAFAYPDDDGDLIAWAEGGPLTRNGVELARSLAGRTLDREAIVLVSLAANGSWAENAACVAPARFRGMASIAYRLALVAAGEGEVAVSLNGPCHWDFAAGHALVRAAGGELVDEAGAPVRYHRDGGAQTLWCFGGAPEAARALAAADWRRVLRARGAPRPRTTAHVAAASRLARAQGCLLGQLAGDALGQLVEFRGARDIAAQYPAGVRDLADGGSWNTLAGQPTDDSELALALARSLVEHRRFDPEAVLGRYAAWFDSRPFDIGRTTSAALGAASAAPAGQRVPAARAAANAGSEANGSLMRVSPLGVFGAAQSREAAAWAREDSALTHPSPVCGAACAAFVTAIATAISGGERDDAYVAALTAVDPALDGDAQVHAALVRATAGPPASFERNVGWVLIALQNAFHQLLRARDLEAALVDTVGRGGDTDTNAAICGALLGAALGRDAVPLRWRRSVLTCRAIPAAGAAHPRPPEYWPVDALELAEALLAAGDASAVSG